MNNIVTKFRNAVPSVCQASKCDKDGCSVSMKGAPKPRVIIDMDCDKLVIKGSRCDYLLVGGENQNIAWVMPIELKSGGFKVNKVKEQLQGGALFAQKFLAGGDKFKFLPILAHGKSIHPADMRKLREVRITLLGNIQQPRLIRCGNALPVFQPSLRGDSPARSVSTSTIRPSPGARSRKNSAT